MLLKFWPRKKGILAMTKPENKEPRIWKREILKTPCRFYLSIPPIMLGFIMSPMGLCAIFLVSCPPSSLQK